MYSLLWSGSSSHRRQSWRSNAFGTNNVSIGDTVCFGRVSVLAGDSREGLSLSVYSVSFKDPVFFGGRVRFSKRKVVTNNALLKHTGTFRCLSLIYALTRNSCESELGSHKEQLWVWVRRSQGAAMSLWRSVGSLDQIKSDSVYVSSYIWQSKLSCSDKKRLIRTGVQYIPEKEEISVLNKQNKT